MQGYANLCVPLQYNLYSMKDLQRTTLCMELAGLTHVNDSGLSNNVLASLMSTTVNFSVYNMMVYLMACNRKLEILDLMEEPYYAESADDVHNIISTLLNKYKRKLSEMNSAIEMTYTPPSKKQASLSINTFLNILEYFNCKIDFVTL